MVALIADHVAEKPLLDQTDGLDAEADAEDAVERGG